MKQDEWTAWAQKRMDELTREVERHKQEIATLNRVAVQRAADLQRERERGDRLVAKLNKIARAMEADA